MVLGVGWYFHSCNTWLHIYGQTLSWQVIMGLFLIIIGLTLVNMFSSKVIN